MRSNLLRSFLLGLLALSIIALPALAQDTVGKFTLPFATNWGGASLPAGEYNFKLDPSGVHWMEVKNADKTYFVRFAYTGDLKGAAKSQLYIITPEGLTPTVHILYLANRETAFFFNVPEKYRVSHEIKYVPVLTPPEPNS